MTDRGRYFAIRTISRLPDRVKLWLSRTPPVVVDGQQLDPQVQVILSVRRKLGKAGLLQPTVAAGRARYRRETANYAGPLTKVASVHDFTIGALRVRHYAPAVRDTRFGLPSASAAEAAAAPPLTVYLHGGGFVIGDLDTHDEPCRILCRHGETHVLAVDYRLAPEHPFPAGLEDAAAALAWAQENAASLGADPERIGIGGDSAGANLATVVSRMASRKPAAQLLIYPPTDGTRPRRSHELFGKDYFLSVLDREGFEECYLGGAGLPEGDPRVSPLLAPDLSGLPPALVITAGFDILRDEGEAYADALRAAGVSVQSRRYPGLGHGFIHLTGICATARNAMREIARDWRAMLSS